jgi:hypothetical protein
VRAGLQFQHLRVLLLASCAIADWSSVNSLAWLPRLKDLRLTDNPVLHFSSLGGRCECIARVSTLTRLNGADVSVHERRDSELRYLRNALQRIADLGGAGVAEAASHPRLDALKAVYGEPEIVARIKVGAEGDTLDARLLDIDVVCTGAHFLGLGHCFAPSVVRLVDVVVLAGGGHRMAMFPCMYESVSAPRPCPSWSLNY